MHPIKLLAELQRKGTRLKTALAAATCCFTALFQQQPKSASTGFTEELNQCYHLQTC